MNKRIRIFSKQTLTLTLLMVLLMALIVIRASYLGGIARSSRISADYDKGQRATKPEGAGEPLGHFVASYTLGQDSYDQSFSIESPSSQFLGECGMGISEIVSAGPPVNITAFEVWLFDKNDICTITKVLTSKYAYHDDALRAKLAPKGEAILVEPGKVIALETASLRVDAEISEMEYAPSTGSGYRAEAVPPPKLFHQTHG